MKDKIARESINYTVNRLENIEKRQNEKIDNIEDMLHMKKEFCAGFSSFSSGYYVRYQPLKEQIQLLNEKIDLLFNYLNVEIQKQTLNARLVKRGKK